jgi:hypothetical protein
MSAITSWNESADSATQDIYRLLAERSESPAPTLDMIRSLFDAFDADQVGELPAAQKNKFEWIDNPVDFWIELGATAIRWGKENGYVVLREELHSTLVRKQTDYGHHNIARYGMIGLIIRVHDKIARLENLMKQKISPNNESIQDTIVDIAGYSSIGIMWSYGQFMLPLE